MTDAIPSRAAMLADVRGLREDEKIRSWHGGVCRGRSGDGYFLDLRVHTNQRRLYRVGVDVEGNLYASEGRITPKRLLTAERRASDVANDLRVYQAWRSGALA
jgi:hypothetical protein